MRGVVPIACDIGGADIPIVPIGVGVEVVGICGCINENERSDGELVLELVSIGAACTGACTGGVKFVGKFDLRFE